jgi:hypothetical protein
MAERKLDNDQRHMVLRMHAEGLGPLEISKFLLETYNIKITTNSIYDTCRTKVNEKFVKSYRETYLAKVKEVPIANKRIRVDDLEKVRTKLIQLMEKNTCETKSQKAEYVSLSGELRRITDCAREEMERKPNLISTTIMNMNEVSDGELHSRKEELIRKAQRIVGGGASGDNPDRGSSESEDFSESP